jgi:hypothetical protein
VVQWRKLLLGFTCLFVIEAHDVHQRGRKERARYSEKELAFAEKVKCPRMSESLKKKLTYREIW